MFERFTEQAIKTIMLAQEESRRLGHNHLGSGMILLGLIGLGTGIASRALKDSGVTLTAARVEVEKIIGPGDGFVAIHIPFSPRAKRVLEFSWDEAKEPGHNFIGSEHLLLGLLHEEDGVAIDALRALGVDLASLRTNVMEGLAQLSSDPEADSQADTRRVRTAFEIVGSLIGWVCKLFR